MFIRTLIVLALSAISMLGAGVFSGPVVPVFNAGDFSQHRENPYFPLRPGTTFFYRAMTEDGVETSIFEVTHQNKTILGVQTTVIHDREFLDGELVEDTFDWYASDKYGNVWYFGEDTAEIEDGEVVSTSGSWQAGVDGALPGTVMLANPVVGTTYQEEDFPGEAEDMARIQSVSKTVRFPAGWAFPSSIFAPRRFENVLKTRNWNPLDPGPVEFKYYALGVGSVLEVQHDEDGVTRKRLVSVTRE
jgi:hypothetical protein